MGAAATTLNVSLDFLAGLVEVPASAQDLLYSLQEKSARDRLYSLQEKDAQVLDMRTRERVFKPSDHIAHIELMDARASSAGPSRTARV